jgi:alcohol dehydrogenase
MVSRNARAAIFHQSNTPLKTIEIPIPPLKSGEILVKNTCTTLCRSDLNTYVGKRQEKTPTILGHEVVGRIAEMDQYMPCFDIRNNRLETGDLVTWGIFSSCPDCEMAHRGIPQKAAELFKYGHEQLSETNTLNGGLSEYTILRVNTPIVKLNENIPVKIAAIINCAVATVSGAMRLAGDLQHKNILVSGTGMLGLVACAMAKTSGAQQVIAVDIDDARLEMAQKFGADICVRADTDYADELTKHFGKTNTIDIVIEISGVEQAMEYTLNLMGIGGTAVWIGAVFPQKDVSISAEKIIRNIWTIKGLHNYNKEDLINAVVFIEKFHNHFPFENLIHDHFELYQINEAFEYAIKNNPYRVGIRF